MDRQQRLEPLIAQAQQLMVEELKRLAGRTMGANLEALLRGFGPALQALLTGTQADSSYKVLGLDPSAPDEVVRLVYRHLAQRCHPDHGGSPEAMARLNRAYEEIGKERGWKHGSFRADTG